MDQPLTTFHDGERAVQSRVGVLDQVAERGARAIRDYMPEQHRAFFALLPFLPMALETKDGTPAAAMATGQPGFVSSPDPRRLRIASAVLGDCDARLRFEPGAPIGLLGIDLSTRRRNRANGHVARIDADAFEVAVTQSFGNCPQYIQSRTLMRTDAPTLTGCENLAGIDADARSLIEGADTLFVASGGAGGLDMSHRGGRPGFVRVDADVLTLPDFAGNRYFNTLGNFAINPRAALLIPDFSTGDLLHVSGDVEIVWDGDEIRRVRRAERLWRVRLAAAWRRRGALPLRWALREQAPTTAATGIWNDVGDG